jgi:hypothetical protein
MGWPLPQQSGWSAFRITRAIKPNALTYHNVDFCGIGGIPIRRSIKEMAEW